jgi:FtsZ-binding cell division protein ZapB
MTAPISRHDDTDTLASLEDRILRAVETVNHLRQEKESAETRAQSAVSDLEAAEKTAAALKAENERLKDEVDSLRAERKQVRGRIEKLLGQLDTLAG